MGSSPCPTATVDRVTSDDPPRPPIVATGIWLRGRRQHGVFAPHRDVRWRVSAASGGGHRTQILENPRGPAAPGAVQPRKPRSVRPGIARTNLPGSQRPQPPARAGQAPPSPCPDAGTPAMSPSSALRPPRQWERSRWIGWRGRGVVAAAAMRQWATAGRSRIRRRKSRAAPPTTPPGPRQFFRRSPSDQAWPLCRSARPRGPSRQFRRLPRSASCPAHDAGPG
jgi:hypothetical protein